MQKLKATYVPAAVICLMLAACGDAFDGQGTAATGGSTGLTTTAGTGGASQASGGGGGAASGSGGSGTTATTATGGGGGAGTTTSGAGGASTSTGAGGQAAAGGTGGAGGVCEPKSCVVEDIQCGKLDDGCGGILDCGLYVKKPVCDYTDPPLTTCTCEDPAYPIAYRCQNGATHENPPPPGDCIPNAKTYHQSGGYLWCCKK